MRDLEDALRRIRGGDARAFEDVYRALSGPLLSYVGARVRRREDAEDVLGQVFLEAFRGIDRFHGDAAGLRAWLFRIARDRSIDLARRLTRRPEVPIEAAGEPAGAPSAEAATMDALERRRLWAAVAALPEQQREVIVLRLASGLSSSEIGRVLGKPTGAVKALQHRALANLTKALGGNGDNSEPPRSPGIPERGDPAL